MRVLRILNFLAIVAALALLSGCERKVVNEAKNETLSQVGCFGCHGETSFNGELLAAHGEWEHSFHASGRVADYGNREAPGSDCARCHNHEGFVEFLTTGQLTSPYEAVSAIHCFTCHAPHETGTLKLRTDAPFTLLNGDVFNHGEGNLCANCHHSRTDIRTIKSTDTTSYKLTTRFGPHHGPQGDMLNRSNGYEYANPSVPYQTSPHATAVTNACVGCHMSKATIEEGYKVGGHSMNMVDEESGTNLVATCQKCHTAFVTGDEYNQKLTDIDGDGVVNGFQDEMDGLADSLAVLLGDLLVPQTGGGYLVKNNAWVKRDVAGAVYNFVTYEDDRSHGVHNPLYFQTLLKNSIAWLKAHPAPASSSVAIRQD